MDVLKESQIHRLWIERAAEVAHKSMCLRAKAGSIILKEGRLIGEGHNSPPGDKCITECLKDSLPSCFKSDKTCCVHAEQRAIMDALKKNPDKIQGSAIYFTRVDYDGNPIPSGEPYCTICSKMALDSGIARFVLHCGDGYRIYDAQEYNEISFSHWRWIEKT